MLPFTTSRFFLKSLKFIKKAKIVKEKLNKKCFFLEIRNNEFNQVDMKECIDDHKTFTRRCPLNGFLLTYFFVDSKKTRMRI